MRTLAISALLLALFACSGRSPAEEPTATTGGQGEEANPYNVVYKGTDGPGVGRHIVLIAGDHEYRSEEILPAMGRLLAKRFGFKCSVFFTLDDEGFIEPGSSDIEGLVALETADLLVAGLRFQDFAAAEMQHVVDYLDRGGPVLGIRTSTYAFRIADGPFAKYSYDYNGQEYEGGFGRQILGETWVGHYGENHEQSSRLILQEANDDGAQMILSGVGDVHVQSGGYNADPMPDSVVLALGQVLDGMSADSPPARGKEELPVAWIRSYQTQSGNSGRVFATTHGASEDFLNEGFRRLLINATLWALEMETAITADIDVSLVGPYNPVTFAFDGYRLGVRPADLAGWETPIMSKDRSTSR